MDEFSRDGLRELLLDVAPPSDASREAMFAQTFTEGSEGVGADLLPPDEWYDADPAGLDDPADDPDADLGTDVDLTVDDTDTDTADEGGPADLYGDPGHPVEHEAGHTGHDADADAGFGDTGYGDTGPDVTGGW